MFESAKAHLRDWVDKVDERLTGIGPQTNESTTGRDLRPDTAIAEMSTVRNLGEASIHGTSPEC